MERERLRSALSEMSSVGYAAVAVAAVAAPVAGAGAGAGAGADAAGLLPLPEAAACGEVWEAGADIRSRRRGPEGR